MKNLAFTSALYLILFLLLTASLPNHHQKTETAGLKSDTSANYFDGSYEGFSRDGYTSENFWGHIRLTISGGAFTDVWFTIRDSSSHEPVDSVYGVNHYSGNHVYMQQCVDDGHGIENYPHVLLTTQCFDRVDAVSGATWSYNIFMACAGEALKDAEKPDLVRNAVDQATDDRLCIAPNPFASAVNIEYILPEPGFVNLCLYNNKGDRIRLLENADRTMGSHTVCWDGQTPAGIYFCCLRFENTLICKKMIRV